MVDGARVLAETIVGHQALVMSPALHSGILRGDLELGDRLAEEPTLHERAAEFKTSLRIVGVLLQILLVALQFLPVL